MSKQVQPVNVCILSGQTTIHGDIITTYDVHVDATVYGNIHAGGKVVISDDARVFGNVSAISAVVSGLVRGDVTIEEKLVCQMNSRISGEVSCKQIVVEEGAVLNGSLTMGVEAAAFLFPVDKERCLKTKGTATKNLIQVAKSCTNRLAVDTEQAKLEVRDELKTDLLTKSGRFKFNLNLW
ncbi:hypothetical protein A3SI_14309 [Nitritalea halalkaliphila LW7]|uniref:Polymer-forming cytoskeletal protein n=1 Tax=Nitritalea halalkaliphila LW7 TaxID=1189621 RepID=I5BZU2_9BACT|nr:polymer-forming cytoskeletal protein [Nitritalea halalkaliphila]EIM75094.1 hypothetical protein A3SI_14309 [Nitritalea halalkaliphila LW7]